MGFMILLFGYKIDLTILDSSHFYLIDIKTIDKYVINLGTFKTKQWCQYIPKKN